MAPKKRPYDDVERHNSKKRSYDSEGNSERNSEGNGIIEAKRRHLFRRDKEKREIDKYCWICHKLGQDTNCNICMRVYHDDCLTRSSGEFNDLSVCPECQLDSLDGAEISNYLTLDKLKQLLKTVTNRVYDKREEGMDILLWWPNFPENDKLVRIIDFNVLLNDINKGIHYTNTADFYSDIKFMYHNCCIMFGANSKLARAAEQLRKSFKKELLDLESCPECYYHLYCHEPNKQDRFVRLCDHPHDIVWAQLTGHPYWPAKCLKVANGIAHVRFFGEHEVSDLSLKRIFHISESHPNFKNSKNTSTANSVPKSLSYKAAIMELEKYIKLYTLVCGEFPYYPHQTYYKPGKSQEEDEAEVISTAEDKENRLSYGTNRSIQLKLKDNPLNSSAVTSVDMTFTTVEPDPIVTGITLSTDCFSRSTTANESVTYGLFDNPLNSSAVTSVDMTFSTIETDPIVTDMTALSTDCFSRSTTANESTNDLDNILKTDNLNSMREISATTIAPLSAEHSEGTILSGNPLSLLNSSISLVQGSSTISSQTPIAVRNSEPIPAVPDEAQTENPNASNPSESMDDEVIILDPPAYGPVFNPALVLPVLLKNAELKNLFEEGQFTLAAYFTRQWSLAQMSPSAPERLTEAIENCKKFESLFREKENKKLSLEFQVKKNAKKLSKCQEELQNTLSKLKYQTDRCKQEELKYQQALMSSAIDDRRKKLAQTDKKWTEKYNALLIQMEEVTKERDKLKTEQCEKKSRGNDC